MFWGLIMEPKKRYTQTVETPFHVSKAALDLYNCDDGPTQLILTHNTRNYLLCTLQKDRILQCSLNLNFGAGDQICFATNGKCNIHLSGFLVQEFDEEDDELSEDEEISSTFTKKRKGLASSQQPLKKSKTEQLLDEVDNYDSEDDTTFELQEAEEDSDDDEVVEEEEDDDDDEEEASDNDVEDEVASSLSDNEEEVILEETKPKALNGISSKTGEKKKKKQKLKEQVVITKTTKSDTPIKTPNKSNQKTDAAEKVQSPLKRTLEGGVMIHDLKVGDGQAVKSGKMVQVYYEGRLKQNNKMFDSNKQGPGFKFRVGKQEVLKGWDVGLVGMKVGGKRRITCPPQMAYGQKGSPPVIPPNSTLIFEVEVKNVL